MSRPLRLEYAGALYHVTSRGNEHKAIYLQESDYKKFLKVLEQVCQRYNWLIHAYCLMTNHYHILVETPEANLSIGMRQLNGVYTQAFNRRHQRVGHLLQGRFNAVLVQKDSHLLEVCRYIVLNPVRAAMVAHCQQWRWSSYGVSCAPHLAPEWLAVDAMLRLFSADLITAIWRYQEFVAQGVGVNLWSQLKHQLYLGSDEFVRQMQEQMPDEELLAEVPFAQKSRDVQPLEWYTTQHADCRNAAIRAAYGSGGYTLAELSSHFKLHYATISRIISNK
ncbi:transposase [Rheinheimera marina]|uniref:Transposase n=1 Tax=Rheinheimera marina TaxID=1774958 RepID=A0ABV9JR64_9GAMM